jgi:two-component system NtrC family sensor kinase
MIPRRRADPGAPADPLPELARLQAIALEAVHDAIMVTDRVGTIIWTNPAFTRLTGYTAEEALGGTPRLLKSGRQPRRFYRDLWATILAGRPWTGQLVNRRKDGTSYTERQTITPVRDETGRVAYFVVVKRDVTAPRRTRQALRDSERRFRALIENALDVITVIDFDGVIRYESPAVERLLGYTPQELVGQRVFAFLPPEEQAVLRALLQEGAGQPGYTASLEFRFRHRDGSWRVFEGVGRNLAHDPLVGGIIVNARDITDRKHTEAELQRQREARYQSEKLADMGTLLAGVAHELNNPLAVIIGYAALTQMAVTDGPLAERVGLMARAAERCVRIVRNFLTLARQHPQQRETVRLNQIVTEAVELLGYSLRVDTVHAQLDLASDLPLLWADPHQLHQVVVNLVTNAQHALREATGRRELTLTTRFDMARQQLELLVRDSGPGIPLEVQPRIFEPFFTTKPAGQGTGLGLPICQGIVESHGGTIRIESAPGQGTTVRIELPWVAPPPDAAPLSRRPVVRAAPLRVLVVDDEPIVAAAIADMLRHHGCAVVTTTSAHAALAQLRAEPFDAVLCDVRMPEMDGPALYVELERAASPLLDRIIFITGDTLSPRTREFLQRPGIRSLTKPVNLEELTRAVDELLPEDPR